MLDLCPGVESKPGGKEAPKSSISPAGSSLLRHGVFTPCLFLLFTEKSFREQQCEKYNAYNYTDMDGNLLQWVPKYSGVSPRDRCKLFCRARGRSEFKVFEAKVRLISWNSDPQMRLKVTYHHHHLSHPPLHHHQGLPLCPPDPLFSCCR